jgi:hypothetical protein
LSQSFPTRVNIKDADKHFHRGGFQRKPDSDVKVFRPGARHYLHPSLSILDRVDCELVYYKAHKVIVVSYESANESIDNTDYTRKAYGKCVMSGDVDFVVDVIREYIEDKRKEQEEYNNSINSSVQAEHMNITMEGTPV